MTKIKLGLFLICCMLLFENSNAQEAVNNNNLQKKCLPVGCTIKEEMNSSDPLKKQMVVTNIFWTFDNKGRLLWDSLDFDGKHDGLIPTRHYNYIEGSNDIIIYSGGDTATVQMNKLGWADKISLNYGDFYSAQYAANGRLERVTNHTAKLQDYSICMGIDSIIYSNDNIVSYREIDSFYDDKKQEWRVHFSVYTCDYYPDKLYSSPYDPTFKIFGGCGFLYFSAFPFAFQTYCRNLVKTVENRDHREKQAYNYKTDKAGRVLQMQQKAFDADSTHESVWDFKYPCE